MNRSKAVSLAAKWAEGGVCTLRESEMREYHKICLEALRAQKQNAPLTGWISVNDRLPEPGERVLATDGGFVGEFYINKRDQWQRYNVNDYRLLMALDILWWMPLPSPR